MNNLTTQQPSFEDDVLTPEEAAALIAADGQNDEAAQRAAAAVHEMKFVPTFRYSTDDVELSLYVGDHKVWSGKKLVFAVIEVTASRALWKPKGGPDEIVMPVCQARYINPLKFDRMDDKGIGRWSVNEHYSAPHDEDADIANGGDCAVECKNCPWNVFGSAGEWEPGREGSRAKACKEDRTLYVVPLLRGKEIEGSEDDMYYWKQKPEFNRSPSNKHPFAMLDVTMGSNKKFVDAIGQTAVAARKPLAAMAYEATVRHDKAGDYEVAILDVKAVGLVDMPAYVNHMKKAKYEVDQFILRNTTELPF